METTLPENNQHHHGNLGAGAHFGKKEILCWVLVALFAVLPVILLLLRICKKISEYRKSRRQCRSGRDSNLSSIRVSESSYISTIPVKQDYINLAPPYYSTVSSSGHSTYELPPPYSPTIR